MASSSSSSSSSFSPSLQLHLPRPPLFTPVKRKPDLSNLLQKNFFLYLIRAVFRYFFRRFQKNTAERRRKKRRRRSEEKNPNLRIQHTGMSPLRFIPPHLPVAKRRRERRRNLNLCVRNPRSLTVPKW